MSIVPLSRLHDAAHDRDDERERAGPDNVPSLTHRARPYRRKCEPAPLSAAYFFAPVIFSMRRAMVAQ